MKINSNLFYWALIAGLLGFILYQKGLILTDFEKVDAQTAYTFLSDNNTTILDVRTDEELKTDGMIEGALHIPLQALNKNIGKLRPYKGKKIVVYCRSGSRSIAASRILSSAGFKTYNLTGGINEWKKQKLPLR